MFILLSLTGADVYIPLAFLTPLWTLCKFSVALLSFSYNYINRLHHLVYIYNIFYFLCYFTAKSVWAARYFFGFCFALTSDFHIFEFLQVKYYDWGS